jgi:prepilin-type N-terminal cleavage/methylation domain-containing protein/prepilin-type processing-associated H-X9-DG protein
MMPRRLNRGGDRGFTLIELLVVIAIISMLASMLMPVYSRARESARKIVCTSGLKQIATAISMYTADHDDCYPIAWAFWGPVNSPALPMTPNLKTCIGSYVRNDEVWWCPSWSGRYGINAWGNPNGSGFDFIVPSATTQEVIGAPASDTSPGSCWSEASLAMPTDYPLLWCGSHWTNALNAHSGASDAAFRAGNDRGGTNIAYADGHVKWVPLDWNKWMQIYQTRR